MQREVQRKMNKKGDISIVILVIGIIAICFLAILSFVKSDNDVDDNFLGIGLIETMNSVEEELNFYEKTEFEGDYGNIELIELGNVKITTDGKKVLKETYYDTERNFPNIFTTKEKILVWVEYKK